MNRLDNVLGPENWWDEYVPPENSVLCRLTIRLPDGSTLTKSDAGGYAGMADPGDDDKSGYSDAFKRAAVKFGVARYLYRDGVPAFVQERAFPAAIAEAKAQARRVSGLVIHGDPGRLAASGPRQATANGNAPRSGKALFAWTKEQEQRYEVGLLKYLNGWAKLQEFPGRMVDWDAEQVGLAYAEACRKLQSIQAAPVGGLRGSAGQLNRRSGPRPRSSPGVAPAPGISFRHPGYLGRDRGLAPELLREVRRQPGLSPAGSIDYLIYKGDGASRGRDPVPTSLSELGSVPDRGRSGRSLARGRHPTSSANRGRRIEDRG